MALKRAVEALIIHAVEDRELAHAIMRRLEHCGVPTNCRSRVVPREDEALDLLRRRQQSVRFCLVLFGLNAADKAWLEGCFSLESIEELRRDGVAVIHLECDPRILYEVKRELCRERHLACGQQDKLTQIVGKALRQIESAKRAQREYLAYLRTGAWDAPDAMELLKKTVLHSRDQRAQQAALTGLGRHGDGEAALIVAERLLDDWGLRAIERAIRTAGKFLHECGLIILSATLFTDDRVLREKWRAIVRNLTASGERQAAKKILELGDTIVDLGRSETANEWLDVLVTSGNPDLSAGALFGAQFQQFRHSQNLHLRLPSAQEVTQANEYVESKIPGLEDVFRKSLGRRKAVVAATPELPTGKRSLAVGLTKRDSLADSRNSHSF